MVLVTEYVVTNNFIYSNKFTPLREKSHKGGVVTMQLDHIHHPRIQDVAIVCELFYRKKQSHLP